MKTLFEIVQENPQKVDEEKVKQYIDTFIKAYDNAKTPEEKAELRLKIDAEFAEPYDKEAAKEATPEFKNLVMHLMEAMALVQDHVRENYERKGDRYIMPEEEYMKMYGQIVEKTAETYMKLEEVTAEEKKRFAKRLNHYKEQGYARALHAMEFRGNPKYRKAAYIAEAEHMNAAAVVIQCTLNPIDKLFAAQLRLEMPKNLREI